MNWYSVVFGLTVAASAASSFGGEREWWIPGPASLHSGAIGDGYLLSYQWEPSDGPEWREPRSLAIHLVPAERWLAAEEFEPRDIRWLVADLAEGWVRPLPQIMPGQARGLRLIPMRRRRHNAFHRWRLAYGWFWATSLRCDAGAGYESWLLRMPFPLVELASSHGRDSGPAIVLSRDGARRVPQETAGAGQQSKAALAPDRLPDRQPPMVPFSIRASTSFMPTAKALGRQAPPDPRRGGGVRVDFDFVPVCENSKEEVTFFVLAENVISVWTKHWEPATRKSGRSYLRGGQWERLAIFAAPFIEPFHVAAADGAYFFVTDESGEVYAAKEVGGQWETRTVWKDPDRPILAMLTKSDGSAPFVFGKDFYFQLARKIERNACEDITKGRPDLGDPMRTVLACAKVLHKAGLLKATQPRQ